MTYYQTTFWARPTPQRELAWQAHCVSIYRLRARLPFFEVEADRGLVLPTRHGVLAKLLGRFGYALVPLTQLENLSKAVDEVVMAA